MKTGDIFYELKCYGRYYKCHIVSIFEDLNEKQVVYRFYGKHKQYWHYKIIDYKSLIQYLNDNITYKRCLR